MNELTKQDLTRAVAAAIEEAGLDHRDFPGLTMHVLTSGAVDLRSDSVGGRAGYPPRDVVEWIIVNPANAGGTRVSKNAINLVALAGAVIAAASDSTSVTSYVSLLLALVAAFSATINRNEAALLVALKQLEQEGGTCTPVAVAGRMTTLLERTISSADVLDVVNQLRAAGVPFQDGVDANEEIVCKEVTVFLPQRRL
ncbi:hypothetical protein ACM9XB_06525 [Xanthomonas sacchari]